MGKISKDANPIKRVWIPRVASPALPVAKIIKFDFFGNEMPEPHVHEKDSDSIWNTYEALRAAEVEALAAAAGEVKPAADA